MNTIILLHLNRVPEAPDTYKIMMIVGGCGVLSGQSYTSLVCWSLASRLGVQINSSQRKYDLYVHLKAGVALGKV